MANKGIVFDETEEARKLASVYMEIADGKGDHNPATRFFMQLLNKQIAEVEGRQKRACWRYYGFSILGLGFSGLTTLLLGLKMNKEQFWGEQQENIALIFSTLATLITGIASLWDVSNYFFRIKVMCNGLKLLRYRFVLDVKESEAGLKLEQIGQYEQQLLTIVGDGYWARRLEKNANERNVQPVGQAQSGVDPTAATTESMDEEVNN